jgi:hypothetical protein
MRRNVSVRCDLHVAPSPGIRQVQVNVEGVYVETRNEQYEPAMFKTEGCGRDGSAGLSLWAREMKKLITHKF